jgi:hypothetical protein
MLKLINHIIKEDHTCHGASLQVRQFTQNCAHQIATIKIACILNNSELSRIGDWATRKNWWYQWLYCSCNFIFYSKFQAVAGITPKALTSNKISSRVLKWLVGPSGSRLCLLIFYFLDLPKSDNGKFNHQYKLLGEKKRGNWGYKINAEKNSSKDIKEEKKLYRSILRKDKYTSLELAVRSLYGLCTTGLLWARLPCSIGIGDKLSWGNFPRTCGRSRALNSPLQQPRSLMWHKRSIKNICGDLWIYKTRLST